VLEPSRYGKLLHEGLSCVADGSLDGQLARRLPSVVVKDEGGLVEGGRRLVGVDRKWVMDLPKVSEEY
jgi:hypothetical protein